jgi:hypothetical protein
MSNRINSILLLTFLIFISCEQTQDLAGGSTDVETGGISGVAKINGNSSLSEGTLITLNQVQQDDEGQARLLADSLYSTLVDQEGQFGFSSLSPGIYSIESYQASSGKRNLNAKVKVVSDSVTTVESIMHTPGSIKLMNIPLEFQNSSYSVYISDLRLQKSLKENTSILTLSDIPAGVSIEVRYQKSLIDQGLITTITLSEDLDATINWP